MMKPSGEPVPVKYFLAMLRARKHATLSDVLLHTLELHWGSIDYQSQDYPFDQTDYYQEEMGEGLQRRLLAFAELRSPEELAAAKCKCIEIEHKLSHAGKRTVNLDIGYLDHNKIVLASIKGLGQKIYLSRGVYADLVARYGHGRYQPFEWTFPDFKEGRYDKDLETIRQRYLEQLKELRHAT